MSEKAQVWWQPEDLDVDRWKPEIEGFLARAETAHDRGLFPQSFILVGPKGLGRELAAVRLAAMLTCPEFGGPWCDCQSCSRVFRGCHPDVVGVFRRLNKNTGKLKKHICIEWVREIVDTAPSKPYEGRRRVWIFSGAEPADLGIEAANAFLKTLEEPPDHAVFILLAENPDAVLPTVSSRCQHLALPGTVAVARRLADSSLPPELAQSVFGGNETSDAARTIRDALGSGCGGESRHLLRLPYALPDSVPPFAAVAAVALEMASEAEEEPAGEELAGLAADLLEVERRSRALNLNPRGQMVSCLMRWYRDL